MKTDTFVIQLESLTLEEVSDIPDFRDVKTKANISHARFLELVEQAGPQERNSGYVEFHLGDNRESVKLHPSTKISSYAKSAPRKRSKSMNFRSSTPLLSHPRALAQPKTVHFIRQAKPKRPQVRSKVQKSSPEPEKRPRRKIDYRRYKDIQPLNEDLLDMIPPDVDALGFEMDTLFLDTPEANESDYDSVSGFSSCSSDSEYLTCNELNDKLQAISTLTTPLDRPGVKLDMDLIRPPPKYVLDSLPKSSVYTCENPKCCFTTTNSTNIRLHCCNRTFN